jgi:hypothetical protein
MFVEFDEKMFRVPKERHQLEKILMPLLCNSIFLPPNYYKYDVPTELKADFRLV